MCNCALGKHSNIKHMCTSLLFFVVFTLQDVQYKKKPRVGNKEVCRAFAVSREVEHLQYREKPSIHSIESTRQFEV